MSDTPYTRIDSLGTIYDRRVIVGSLVVHFCIFEASPLSFHWAMPDDVKAFIEAREPTLAANGPFASQDEAEKSCVAYFDELRTKALKRIEEDLENADRWSDKWGMGPRKGAFKL